MQLYTYLIHHRTHKTNILVRDRKRKRALKLISPFFFKILCTYANIHKHTHNTEFNRTTLKCLKRIICWIFAWSGISFKYAYTNFVCVSSENASNVYHLHDRVIVDQQDDEKKKKEKENKLIEVNISELFYVEAKSGKERSNNNNNNKKSD